MDAAAASTTAESKWVKRLRRARWTLAILISLATLAVVISSLVNQNLQICREVLATVGVEAVVRTCGPVQGSDLWPVTLLLAVLVFPDISELTIPGFGSLKRRVEDQHQRQEALERTVTQVQSIVSQQLSVQFNVPPEWMQTRQHFDEKAGEFVARKEGDDE